jgi:hypothetical protein
MISKCTADACAVTRFGRTVDDGFRPVSGQRDPI